MLVPQPTYSLCHAPTSILLQFTAGDLPNLFYRRLNDNNLELLFPSVDLLRATVEKLSPIMVKNKIVVYVTYKPSILNYLVPPAAPPTLPRRGRRNTPMSLAVPSRARPVTRTLMRPGARVVKGRPLATTPQVRRSSLTPWDFTYY